ncbi:MAG: hypothetical protein GY866_34070 [Proteobacteria bacterium]|nr:hypothetical protein [Pseudomonadota bacterium]
MKQNYQTCLRTVLLSLLIVWTSWNFSAFASDTVPWKWPAGNKKPVWWNWGKTYSAETPVRGGGI